MFMSLDLWHEQPRCARRLTGGFTNKKTETGICSCDIFSKPTLTFNEWQKCIELKSGLDKIWSVTTSKMELWKAGQNWLEGRLATEGRAVFLTFDTSTNYYNPRRCCFTNCPQHNFSTLDTRRHHPMDHRRQKTIFTANNLWHLTWPSTRLLQFYKRGCDDNRKAFWLERSRIDEAVTPRKARPPWNHGSYRVTVTKVTVTVNNRDMWPGHQRWPEYKQLGPIFLELLTRTSLSARHKISREPVSNNIRGQFGWWRAYFYEALFVFLCLANFLRVAALWPLAPLGLTSNCDPQLDLKTFTLTKLY